MYEMFTRSIWRGSMSLVTSVHVEGTSENRRREDPGNQQIYIAYNVLLSSWILET